MPWWAWLLLSWPVLATIAAFLLGALSAKARGRERTWVYEFDGVQSSVEHRRAS